MSLQTLTEPETQVVVRSVAPRSTALGAGVVRGTSPMQLTGPLGATMAHADDSPDVIAEVTIHAAA